MSTKQVPLSPREEEIAKKIVSAAFNVHQHLGPGLLEKIYETCFCYELSKYGLHYRQQVEIPITYDNIVFDAGLRLDILVEDLVICELKAVTEVNPVFQAQVLSYLRKPENALVFLSTLMFL